MAFGANEHNQQNDGNDSIWTRLQNTIQKLFHNNSEQSFGSLFSLEFNVFLAESHRIIKQNFF